jgi:hypothetical protein
MAALVMKMVVLARFQQSAACPWEVLVSLWTAPAYFLAVADAMVQSRRGVQKAVLALTTFLC